MSISGDTAVIALEEIRKQGLLSEEELDRILKSLLTVEMKNAVSLLHGLLCQSHREGKSCSFLSEETFTNCWEQREHVYWVSKVRTLLEGFKINPWEAIGLITKATKIISMLLKDSEGAKNFIFHLMINVIQESSLESQDASQPQQSEELSFSGLEP